MSLFSRLTNRYTLEELAQQYRQLHNMFNPANQNPDLVQPDAQSTTSQDQNQSQQQIPVQQQGQTQQDPIQQQSQEPIQQGQPQAIQDLNQPQQQPQDFTQTQQPQVPQLPSRFEDIKGYLMDPRNRVLESPTKAMLYSLVFKIISVIIAFIFPSMGWLMIGFSLALIDRIIILNCRQLADSMIDRISDYFRQILRNITGSERQTQQQQTS